MSAGQGPVGGSMSADELRIALAANDALSRNGADLLLTLVLAGDVVDVWNDAGADDRSRVHAAWPELYFVLDALAKGPE